MLAAARSHLERAIEFKALVRGDGGHNAKLCHRGEAVVQADFLNDFAVDDLEDSRSSEAHLVAACGRQAAHEKVTKSRTGMRSAALPLANDIIALGDQVGSSPKVEVGESRPEVGYERVAVAAPAARLVQRVYGMARPSFRRRRLAGESGGG